MKMRQNSDHGAYDAVSAGAVDLIDRAHLKNRIERGDPGEETDQVILVAQREHGGDEVVADPLFAQMDLEAIGEERQQLGGGIAAPGSLAAFCTDGESLAKGPGKRQP